MLFWREGFGESVTDTIAFFCLFCGGTLLASHLQHPDFHSHSLSMVSVTLPWVAHPTGSTVTDRRMTRMGPEDEANNSGEQHCRNLSASEREGLRKRRNSMDTGMTRSNNKYNLPIWLKMRGQMMGIAMSIIITMIILGFHASRVSICIEFIFHHAMCLL